MTDTAGSAWVIDGVTWIELTINANISREETDGQHSSFIE
jgi:hypothetical protein